VLQQAGRPRARRRKGPADVDLSIIQSRHLRVPSPLGLMPSSALSPRPRRRLRSSSAAALASYVEVLVKVEINCPILLKFFSCPNPLVLSVFFV
jgi:hypothetical protein